MGNIEKLFTYLPKFTVRAEFKEALKKRIFSTSEKCEIDEEFITPRAPSGLQHYFSRNFAPRFAFMLVILLMVVGGIYFFQKSTGMNVLRPAKVMAAEIIKRSKESFFKPGTIYHHQVKQYVEGATEPIAYELWEDMDTQRFRNHVIYPVSSGGEEVWQWFDLDIQWDVDVAAKTARKDIYRYQNQQERTEKKGESVDLPQQFDELISQGVLEAKEGKLDNRDVYVVYDTRTNQDKYWDMLTFDRKTFQLLRTEKYIGEGENRKLQTLVEYELQESLPKTDALIKQYFSDPPLSLDGFTIIERTFDTSQGYLDDGIQISPENSKITVVIGVIRTSGLSEEEKQKFGLTTVNYQITDFGDYQKAYQEGQVMGYYLLSNTVNDELLGKCVRVAGTIPEEWKNKNKDDSYNHLVLNIASIEKIDNSTCNPYSQTPPAIVDNTQEKLSLRGTIIHGNRPSPDIGYDYQLRLAEPFIDQNSSAGSPQEVSLVDAVPNDNSIWKELENNINKAINVEGYMVWGYAESKYFQITSVKNPTDYD